MTIKSTGIYIFMQATGVGWAAMTTADGRQGTHTGTYHPRDTPAADEAFGMGHVSNGGASGGGSGGGSASDGRMRSRGSSFGGDMPAGGSLPAGTSRHGFTSPVSYDHLGRVMIVITRI